MARATTSDAGAWQVPRRRRTATVLLLAAALVVTSVQGSAAQPVGSADGPAAETSANARAEPSGVIVSPGRGTEPAPIGRTTAVEAPDFASEVYMDPWDFENPGDTPLVIQNNPGLPINPNYLRPAPNSGQVSYSSPDGTQLWLVRNWGTGALATNRDGPLYPIDANRYTRLAMRVHVSGASPIGAGAFWWTCVEQTVACRGGMPFSLQPGWQVVDLPLQNTGAFANHPAPWAGEVSTFLVTTNGGPPASAVTITLDWVRLFAPAGAGASDAYPAGSVVGGTTVLPRPLPLIVTPSREGGQDYATTVRGKGWDMDTLADVAEHYNTTLSVDGSRIVGTTAGPTPNDPVIRLANPGPFNPRRWRHLTFRVGYGGTFGLQDAPGGGMMSRFVWRNPNAVTPTNSAGFQESNDIVIFPGENRIVVDLHTDPPGLVNDDEIERRLGWGGPASRWVNHPEFHPHEDPGSRTWWIWELRIRRNHLAQPTFPIRFRDDQWVAGTTADVELATTRGGPVEHTVATGVPVVAGENTYTLDSATLPYQHVYWVKLTLRSPNGAASSAWSLGPVETGTPVEFVDVVPGDTFFDDIFWLVKADIAAGYSPDFYGPTLPISRQAMAAFLYRLFHDGGNPPACASAPFSDVGTTHPFCGHIAWLASSGITGGYPDGTFRPAESISRQAMAAFLYRAANGSTPPPGCTGTAHPDVPAHHVFCPHIAWMGQQAITSIPSSNGYAPGASVSRQAMAAFVHRYHDNVGV
ncbi:MAG: S-layer homology domain-containing protein [Acidimicrobiia bacterium]|nr:S-layer homology domain-containing protein [Acidimicrobiia bacterium]